MAIKAKNGDDDEISALVFRRSWRFAQKIAEKCSRKRRKIVIDVLAGKKITGFTFGMTDA